MSFFPQQVPFTGSGLYLPLAGGTMSGAILVTTDNLTDFATASARWKTLYAYTVDVKTGINGTGALSVDGSAGITIGGTNATGVVIGRAATTTQINGKLRYDNSGGAVGASSGLSIIVNVSGVDYKIDLRN